MTYWINFPESYSDSDALLQQINLLKRNNKEKFDQCRVIQFDPFTLHVFLNYSRIPDRHGYATFFETGIVTESTYGMFYAFDIGVNREDGTVFVDSNYVMDERSSAEFCCFIEKHYVKKHASYWMPSVAAPADHRLSGIKRARHS